MLNLFATNHQFKQHIIIINNFIIRDFLLAGSFAKVLVLRRKKYSIPFQLGITDNSM